MCISAVEPALLLLCSVLRCAASRVKDREGSEAHDGSACVTLLS